MPVCQGRPETGQCPNNKADSSVKFSISDLFLCHDCYEYRVPPTTVVSDNKSASKLRASNTVNATTTSIATTTAMRNELLCFVQQKAGVMAVDHLVKLCADFYRNDEIVAARTCAEQFLPHRMSKRQGADSARKTLEDIVKQCVDPNTQLPVFYATDLSRLPPVDATHCDVSALLKEIQALRAEVREVTQLKTEIEYLKAEVLALSQIRNEIDSMKHQFVKPTNEHSPSTADNSVMPNPATDLIGPIKTSFAAVAGDLVRAVNKGEKPFAVKPNRRPNRRPEPICGKAIGQSTMAVDGMRRCNIFMTRFCPETTTGDIESLVNNVLPKLSSVKVEKQKTRFDSYSSFSLEICVARSNFDELIDAVYSADTWPTGILVRRFYRSKNGSKY